MSSGQDRSNDGPFAFAKLSASHREPLPGMRGALDFIDQRNCVILSTRCCCLSRVAQQLILAEPELAGALARDGTSAEGERKRPVEVPLLAQQLEEFPALAGFRFVGGGKFAACRSP